jgi:hypothetical protein
MATRRSWAPPAQPPKAALADRLIDGFADGS